VILTMNTYDAVVRIATIEGGAVARPASRSCRSSSLPNLEAALLRFGAMSMLAVDWAKVGIAAGISVVAALAISLLGRRWSHRLRDKAKEPTDDEAEGRRRQRRATVAGLIVTTIQALSWFVVLAVTLGATGVPLGPLFASAGVIGVALGFGAQTIVRDTLAGLFIALEGQFDVGDIVDLQTEGGPVNGTIEGLTLRVTTVRQYDGTVSIVPNGGIHVTSNRTRGWGRAIIDVRVALDEDPDRVQKVLERALDEARATPPLSEWLRDPPQVLGVTQLTDVAQVIRVVAETVPNHRVDTERLLRGRISQRISESGIKTPPVIAGPRS
jgi:small conductance mechanosensitive channel